MKSLQPFVLDMRNMYEVEHKSMREIATVFNTSHINIYRILKSNGVKIRNKSEAASNALQTGRSTHPTKGKNMSEKVKEAISNKIYKMYENMSEEERANIQKRAKKQWNKMSPQAKLEFKDRGHKAISDSAKKGSALERWLLLELEKAGMNVYHHTKVLENAAFEVDFYLPDDGIAIELDGPHHFEPIWGEALLEKTRLADAEKNGLAALNGVKMIRVMYKKKHLCNYVKRLTLKKTLEAIETARNSNEYLFRVEI